MKVTVRVDVDQTVRDEAARHLAVQGFTIGQTMRIVLEQAAAGCGPDFGALVPNATTVSAIEAARRGEVVELGSLGGCPRRTKSRELNTAARSAGSLWCARSSGPRSSGSLH